MVSESFQASSVHEDLLLSSVSLLHNDCFLPLYFFTLIHDPFQKLFAVSSPEDQDSLVPLLIFAFQQKAWKNVSRTCVQNSHFGTTRNGTLPCIPVLSSSESCSCFTPSRWEALLFWHNKDAYSDICLAIKRSCSKSFILCSVELPSYILLSSLY